MKMSHLDVPGEFNRNAPSVQALGAENTGSILIEYACNLLGYSDLSDKEVLDVGCGVRFTQTIINRDIPIRSYTGVDVDQPLISYLQNNVRDDRFGFHYWHIYNEKYNPNGKPLTRKTELPFSQDKKFDAIWMFSVITHNNPADTANLLYAVRKYVRRNGFLLFSAFIDNQIPTFEDRLKEAPLTLAYYNEGFLRRIIARNGWRVKSAHDKDLDKSIMNHFVCIPKYRFWESWPLRF